MQRLFIIFVALLSVLPLPAQKKTAGKKRNAKTEVVSKKRDSKKVTNMKNQRNEMQGKLKKHEQDLKKNKKEQEEKKRQIAAIETQIQTRVKHIHTLEERLDSAEQLIKKLESERDSLEKQLALKKERYKKAVRYARNQRFCMSPMTFVLAGNTPMEMVRRARYAKQYATFQRRLGEAVMAKRDETLANHHKILREKANMDRLLREVMEQRKRLGDDRQRQQDVLNGLAKKGQSIEGDIKKQRKQITDLEREIEKQIAYEIEQARKKAEEEARKKAEEEARRKAAAAKSNKTPNANNTPNNSKAAPKPTSSKPASVWHTSEDIALSGSFERNKGRLPVPITGSYMITQRFGRYTPEGAHGVVLDSKGVNYTGQQGARARAIFDGVVTAVLNMNGAHHVLIRHGQYISVYCNLSSVIVAKGQKVRTRDLLGAVARDEKGGFTLHMQLHREKTPLNPAVWIGR